MVGIKKPSRGGKPGLGKAGTGRTGVGKATKAGKLTTTSKKGQVELKEDELGKVTGGSFSWGLKL